jgi:hypothetical protein
MATVIDHLSSDYRVLVLQDFTDARGVVYRQGETAIIRHIGLDFSKNEILFEMDRNGKRETIYFDLNATTGPRNGKMREFFELGDYAPLPRPVAVPPVIATYKPAMNTNPPEPSRGKQPDWWDKATELEEKNKLEEAEQAILKAVDHIGGVASVAEMYARRMRHFQRQGNEQKAREAFKKASDWIYYYASCATSGGEGAALSMERDQFLADLVNQFGYDPEQFPEKT